MQSFATRLATLAFTAVLATGCQSESVPTATEIETTELETTGPEKIAVETTPVAFNLEGAPTTQIHVPDMTCDEACPPAVKKVLTALAGVKDVTVDFESRTATVAIDEAKFDSEAAIAALVDYQFGNSKMIATK